MPPARPTARRWLAISATAVLLALAVPTSARAQPGSTPIGPQPVASGTLQQRVDALNDEIARVGDELAAGAVAYEAAQAELARRTQGEFAADAEIDHSAQRSEAARSSVDGLARAAYKGGVPPMLAAFLSGDPGSVGTLAYVQRSIDRVGTRRRVDAARLSTRVVSAQRTLVQSAAQRQAALLARQALDRQLAALSARAVGLSSELTTAAAAVEQARIREQAEALARAQARDRARMVAALADAEQRRAAAAAAAALPYVPGVDSGGGGCQLPNGIGEVNGFLSEAGLCPLRIGGGERLRTDAARAFDLMDAAHVASVGTHLCVADSYRSYAGQVAIFAAKPGLAATPGRSNHGWGIAVDFCGGVQSFGSPEHTWMQANASSFGWIHPAWAEPSGSKPEAWHWEFVGGPRPTGAYPGR